MNNVDSILRCKFKGLAKKLYFFCRDTKTKTKRIGINESAFALRNSKYQQMFMRPSTPKAKDFISKLKQYKGEQAETEYWLDLLLKTGYIEESIYKPCKTNAVQSEMLISSLNTAKEGCR